MTPVRAQGGSKMETPVMGAVALGRGVEMFMVANRKQRKEPCHISPNSPPNCDGLSVMVP